jgi:hypothetical protein
VSAELHLLVRSDVVVRNHDLTHHQVFGRLSSWERVVVQVYYLFCPAVTVPIRAAARRRLRVTSQAQAQALARRRRPGQALPVRPPPTGSRPGLTPADQLESHEVNSDSDRHGDFYSS